MIMDQLHNDQNQMEETSKKEQWSQQIYALCMVQSNLDYSN